MRAVEAWGVKWDVFFTGDPNGVVRLSASACEPRYWAPVRRTTISEMLSAPNPLWWLPSPALRVADLRRVHRWIESAAITPHRRKAMSAGAMVEGGEGQARQPTVSERLAAEEKALVERLEQIRSIRAGMAGVPEVAELIDGLSKLGHLRY
jgi:hypothetical protein